MGIKSIFNRFVRWKFERLQIVDVTFCIKQSTLYCLKHTKNRENTCKNCAIEKQCHNFLTSIQALRTGLLDAIISEIKNKQESADG